LVKVLFALGVAALAAGQPGAAQTGATDKNDVMATVRQFVDGFNKGDTKAAAAACSDQMSI
jgi:hypothetical protein